MPSSSTIRSCGFDRSSTVPCTPGTNILRLLLEDFPKNHNLILILIAQPCFNNTLQLRVNEDLRSRITYSAKIERLAPGHIVAFTNQKPSLPQPAPS